jgi:two-component system, chemotaxis family, protein-glutamate methylesterase/glutaminase
MAIRVLIVDDSALVRKVLSDGLSREADIEVVGTASDPYVARDLIVAKRPDVMTLDVEMPRMDGIDFLRKLIPQHPMPVIMVSSMTDTGTQATLDALAAGAVDFIAKPTTNVGLSLSSVVKELAQKIRLNRFAKVRVKNRAIEKRIVQEPFAVLAGSTDKVIALGASTGGTEALREVLLSFPPNSPGIVIVQHMPPKFTQMYADRLNTESVLEIREAKDGDRIIPGRALIAPGGLQMRVVRSGGQYKVVCSGNEKVSGHCPSVDVLFHSVAEHVGSNAVGAILTGMGGDGAEGLLAMRNAGAHTIGQDEESCVIYGMPKVAFEKGAVMRQLPLNEIGPALIRKIGTQTVGQASRGVMGDR